MEFFSRLRHFHRSLKRTVGLKICAMDKDNGVGIVFGSGGWVGQGRATGVGGNGDNCKLTKIKKNLKRKGIQTLPEENPLYYVALQNLFSVVIKGDSHQRPKRWAMEA